MSGEEWSICCDRHQPASKNKVHPNSNGREIEHVAVQAIAVLPQADLGCGEKWRAQASAGSPCPAGGRREMNGSPIRSCTALAAIVAISVAVGMQVLASAAAT